MTEDVTALATGAADSSDAAVFNRCCLLVLPHDMSIVPPAEELRQKTRRHDKIRRNEDRCRRCQAKRQLRPAPVVHIADENGALLVDYPYGLGTS